MHRTRNQQHRKSHLVRRPARLSYANVAATLALFFALTGTAAAAVTLARDSVGAEHIQADAVGSSEIQADAVRSQEIRDESIALADLTPGARTSLDAPRVRFDERRTGLNSVSTVLRLARLLEPPGDPPPRRALARSGQARRPRRLPDPRQHLRPRPERHHRHRRGAGHRSGPGGLPDQRAGLVARRRDHRAGRRLHHRRAALQRMRTTTSRCTGRAASSRRSR